MIYAAPSTSFEAVADNFPTGLVGTIGVRILDNVGGTTTARATGGITEIATGVYASTLTAPASAGQYSVVWDNVTSFASEDLVVSFATNTFVSVGAGSAPGGGGYSLDYAGQRSAVYENRFPSSSPVAQWLSAAYADVWNAAKWSFKRVSLETWYTSNNGTGSGTPSASPAMPVAFAHIGAVYDDQGCELHQLAPHEFEHRYAGDTTTGAPESFMVVNRQIQLWPTPTSALAFQVSYGRRLATRTSGGAVQAGFYQADTDIPMWDDHHYILVIRAKIIGLRDRSDPTAGDLEGEYSRLLEAMKADYVEALPRGSRLPAWR